MVRNYHNKPKPYNEIMGQMRIQCGVIEDHDGANGDLIWGNPGLPHVNRHLPRWGK